jgi:plasmid stabilization system protein ParE
MNRYILAPPAREDLIAIRDYYLETANPKTARQMLVEFVTAFRTIARTPRIGHKREDLAEDRTVLFWPLREYRVKTQLVEIITVVHGRRDVAQLLKHRDP